MTKLFKDKKVLFILLLILASSLIEDVLGERFLHGEMVRQTNETLKSQAAHILQGYETYDQNSEILRAGIQADALELNRIHGEFLMKAMDQSYREHLRGQLDRDGAERRIADVINRSEEYVGLKGSLIRNAASQRNNLDQLIKNEIQGPGQTVSYMGNTPSELFHSRALDIVIRGGTEQPWETYARAVYYQPLDLIVVFHGTSSYAEDNVARLFHRNQDNLERNIMMVGKMEDVIILQKSGYSLYSGRFEKDNPNRVTRIMYNDMEDPDGIGKQIIGSYGVYRTMMIPTPDGQIQERYGYIVYDTRQNQYIVVSRLAHDIGKRESDLNAISRFVGILNVIVIGLIAFMLVSRDEALKEEAAGP